MRPTLYLRQLRYCAVPTRFSQGAAQRARQLSQFLGGLSAEPGCELWVLKPKDWSCVASYRYGLPWFRYRANAAQLLLPAEYPARFLHQFDDVLLTAGQQGYSPPGELREYLDLLIGHEWAWALLHQRQSLSKVNWLNEVYASAWFLQALKTSGWSALYERRLAWARLEACLAVPVSIANFSLPRSKHPLRELLYLQGILTLAALHWLSATDAVKTAFEHAAKANPGKPELSLRLLQNV